MTDSIYNERVCPICKEVIWKWDKECQKCNPKKKVKKKKMECCRCGKKFKVAIRLSPDLWEKIKHIRSIPKGSLLCPSCIMTLIESISGYERYFLTQKGD